jgi:hypothetical protein
LKNALKKTNYNGTKKKATIIAMLHYHPRADERPSLALHIYLIRRINVKKTLHHTNILSFLM